MANGAQLSLSPAHNALRGSGYLPDFGTANAVVALVLISQLVAVVLSIGVVDAPDGGYFFELARISLLMLWMVLTSACVLTLARPVLSRQGATVATAFSLGLVLANIALLSELIYWLGRNFADSRLIGQSGFFPDARWEFLSRNLFVGAFVCAGVLRYFYVTHQWRTNMEREVQSRLTALQARIRPHFLFNSMNTIAALTRSDPVAAERAVEDLADLFRASLGNPGEPISLAEEIEVARVYQRMEEQRLGDRLRVEWDLDAVPLSSRVPALTLQPLLENAIYHGIEPLPEGGTVTVRATRGDGEIAVTVANPVNPDARQRDGHRIALDNIRQRLELAYGSRARLELKQEPAYFAVTVVIPAEASAAVCVEL